MTNTSKPRFSVVIPCYNEADYITDTLVSLKNQDTDASYEIIVVDNNCTDTTAHIARQHGAKVVTEKQSGISFARQAGTTAARGEIIISTDADTKFATNWLSTIDKEFTYHTGLVAVCGPCQYSDGPWWGKAYTRLLFRASYCYFRIAGHPFYVTATNFAFRKSAWKGYDTTSMQGTDEIGLLHSLRKEGRVRFNVHNKVFTSARRLSRGLFYNLFVTFLFYYLGAYYVNRAFRRTIIGSYPAIRETEQLSSGRKFRFSTEATLLSLIIVLSLSVVGPVRGFIEDNVYDTASAIHGFFKNLV